MQTSSLPAAGGLNVRRELRVSAAEFDTPVPCPYGDTIRLGDRAAMEFASSDKGLLVNGQRLEQRVSADSVEERPTEGFVADGRVHVARERIQQGRAFDSATGDEVVYRQISEGYDGEFRALFRTEVRHSPNGTVAVLEYY